MKTASLTLAALAGMASAKDTAPPVISLNMAERNPFLMKINTINRVDSGGLADSGAPGSSQDFTEMCPAGASSSTSCPLPIAKSYDHHDGVIPVETRIFKMTNSANYNDVDDGCGVNPQEKLCPMAATTHATHGGITGLTTSGSKDIYHHDYSCINYAAKGTYLVKYDSMDRAGNQAHQLVFGLVLDDKVKPRIHLCQTAPRTLEAGSRTPLCTSTTITDNMAITSAEQQTLTDTMRFHIVYSDAASGGAQEVLCGATGCLQSELNTKINTLREGYFLVTVKGNDQACIYGENDVDNDAIDAKFTVSVFDTRAPQIEVIGSDPHVHECNYNYVDQGAQVTDMYDDIDEGCVGGVASNIGHCPSHISITAAWTSPFEKETKGNYEMTYNAVDAAGNNAVQKTREVQVVDTESPAIALVGSSLITHEAAPTYSDPPTDPGTTCTDFCDDAAGVALTTTYQWAKNTATSDPNDRLVWDDRVLGDYVREYTCTDHSGNTDTIVRTFRVVDRTKPLITLVGQNPKYEEADRDDVYTDAGAQCSDYVDGQINDHVRVSGAVVNLRVPGTYEVKYDCKDKSNQVGDTVTRQVIVQDSRKPTITVIEQPYGSSIVNNGGTEELEAGFPYNDLGAIATDDLDGEIQMCDPSTNQPVADNTAGGTIRGETCIRKVGDTVDWSRSFYSASTCAEIKQANPNAPDGNYYITTHTSGSQNDAANFVRTMVSCTMSAEPTTWKLIQGGTSSPQGEGADCASHGLVPFTGGRCDYNFMTASEQALNTGAADVCYPNGPNKATTDTNYLCVATANGQQKGTPSTRQLWKAGALSSTLTNHHSTIDQAQVGKYVIRYSTEDAHGNAADCKYRTVVVRDTLPPVISLHNAAGKILDVSEQPSSGLTGINGAVNRAADDNYNPDLSTKDYFMAEAAQTSTVNGWIIGAVASGVTGLALVAYANKL